MMIFLDTKFNEEENDMLNEYIREFHQDVSVFYSVEADNLLGVDCPTRMISVGGLFLLEEKDEPRQWYMGQKNGDSYSFWGKYGNLKDALYGL